VHETSDRAPYKLVTWSCGGDRQPPEDLRLAGCSQVANSQRGLERERKSCTGVAPRNVDLAGVRAESAVNRDVICLGGICLLIIATIHD
jgi:hypothetical protein